MKLSFKQFLDEMTSTATSGTEESKARKEHAKAIVALLKKVDQNKTTPIFQDTTDALKLKDPDYNILRGTGKNVIPRIDTLTREIANAPVNVTKLFSVRNKLEKIIH